MRAPLPLLLVTSLSLGCAARSPAAEAPITPEPVGLIPIPAEGEEIPLYQFRGVSQDGQVLWQAHNVLPESEPHMAAVAEGVSLETTAQQGRAWMSAEFPIEAVAWLAIEDWFSHNRQTLDAHGSNMHKLQGMTRALIGQTDQNVARSSSRELLEFSPGDGVDCGSMLEHFEVQDEDWVTPYERAVAQLDEEERRRGERSWEIREDLDLDQPSAEVIFQQFARHEEGAPNYEIQLLVSQSLEHGESGESFTRHMLQCRAPYAIFATALSQLSVEVARTEDKWVVQAHRRSD